MIIITSRFRDFLHVGRPGIWAEAAKKFGPCVVGTAFLALAPMANAGVTLTPPTFPDADTVRVTLSGADSNQAYTLQCAPILWNTNASWLAVATGAIGQTVFDINKGSNQSLFFRAVSSVPLMIGDALANGGTNTVKITFSQPVAVPGATNVLNYSLSGGVTISNALLSADGMTVTLIVSGFVQQTIYSLTVTNVVSTNGGTLAANTTVAFNSVASLIGHWKFDEVAGSVLAQDSSANNRTGSLIGSVQRVVGIYGSALSFNGTNGYVDFGNIDLNIGSNFTISFFMQAPPNRSTFGVLLAKGPKTNGHYEVYLGTDGQIRFYAPELGDFGSGRIVDDTFWHHVSITYDGATILFYIDGFVMGGGSVAGTISSTTQRFVLGALYDGVTFPYTGNIDDLEIFNRAIAPDELNNNIDFVAADGDATKIKIAFKNPVATADAVNPSNYVLSGGAFVTSGALSMDGRVVTLNVTPLSSTNYTTLTVRHIRNNELINEMPLQSRSLKYNPNLVQHWTFDDYPTLTQVKNSAINGYDGTPSGTTRVVGQRLKAISFNGTSDYVDMGNAAINLGTNFAFSFWLQAPQSRTADRVILAKGPKSNGHYEIYLSGTNGSLRFYAPEIGDFGTATSVDDTNWHHVAVTYNASHINFYLDGLLSSSTAAAGNISDMTQRLVLGALYDTATNRYNGSLDDLRIYNTILTSNDIAALCPKVVFPQLSTAWGNAPRIVQTADGSESDFLLIKDRRSPAPFWHSMGIHLNDNTLYHAQAPTLQTAPYANLANIGPATTNTVHMWAPGAIWAGPSVCWMYYCDLENTGENGSIRVYESTNLDLSNWHKLNNSSLEQGYISFRESLARDPEVWFDNRVGQYLMYYVSGLNFGISIRTSTNLVNWTGTDGGPISSAVSGTPDGFTASESPFVLLKNGIYYLFSSGFDYGRVAVYASEDPFFFGDGNLDKIGEINGHALELMTENGVAYIAAAAIASTPGHGAGYYDIPGVRLQQLNWVPLGQQIQTGIIPGLLGYWKMDEGNGSAVFDASASGYNGTINGASWISGKSGSALSFNGSSSVIFPAVDLNLYTNFTIAAWVKTATKGVFQVMVEKGPKAAGHYEIYLAPTGEFRFYANEIGDYGSGKMVSDNGWHHLAVTYQGSAINFFVDGVASGSQTAQGAISATTNSILFGNLPDGSLSYNGALDQVRIYNRALSSAEVQSLNNSGL